MPIETRLATPGDALGIRSCFEDAYGDSYCFYEFMDPAVLGHRLSTGATAFNLALERGKIVAATALEPRSDGTGDLCHGAVRPTHRKLGLFTKLNPPLIALARELGLSVLFGRCVTSHTYSQKAMVALGAGVVGLTLSVAPRQLRFLGIREELSQRECVFDLALALAKRTVATVFCPRRLEAPIAACYAALGLEHRVARGRPERETLRFMVVEDRDLSTTTLSFGTSCGVPSKYLDETLEPLEASGAGAVFLELPLGSPATAALAEDAWRRGFSFAAVLPGRAEGGLDVLRLQRPMEEVSPADVLVGVPGAEAMKSFVFEDLATARAGLALS
jgi:hypothetical protein